MPAFERLSTQFLDDNGDPLLNGKLYVGVYGLDPVANPITIYSDAALTTPLANPQTLDSFGRPSNDIYISSDFSYKVTDVDDVQIELKDVDFTTEADEVYFDANVTGSVQRTLQSRLSDVISVRDFGAVGDGTTDDTAAIQAAIDYIRSNYNSSTRSYPGALDLAGKTYKVTSSIDATLFRSPGFELRNGALLGACTGKIVLDLAGCNDVTLRDFKVVGDTTNIPAVGIYFGRCSISGSFSACASMKLFNCRSNGRFSKAAVVNFASEVSTQVGCFWINTSRSLDAYTYINVFHADTLDDYISGLTSDYQTLPVSANGGQSNTLHNMSQTQIQRHSEVVIPITSISKANPAVVTVSPSELSSSELANGDKVYFAGIGGMTELSYASYSVANLNAGAGTFELSGIDSTSYGTFTSGTVRNQTGPAILLSGTQRMVIEATYVLAYGSPPFVIDLQPGSIRSCRFDCHCEPSPARVIDLHYTSAGYSVIQGLKLDLLNANQTIQDEFIGITGGGKVRIDNPIVEVASLAAAPANKVFYPPADFILRDADINVPLEAALNDPDDFAEFSGQTYAPDTQRKKYYGVVHIFMESGGESLNKVGLRWNGSRYVGWDDADGLERAFLHNQVVSSAVFNDISSNVNTFGKFQGKFVWDASTSKPVFSSGSTPGHAWIYADGTTAYTPS